MQIKSTIRYHLAPAEQPSAKSLQIMNSGEKETLLHCYWECKFVQPLWRTIWKFLRKKKKNQTTKNRVIIQGSNPISRQTLREN